MSCPHTTPLDRMRLPVQAWWPQRFLHHLQKWPRTSPYPSATFRRYARQPPTMELDLDHVQYACCENDGIKQKHMVLFASSRVKQRWIFLCCDLGQWMSETWVWVVVRQRWTWRMSEYLLCLRCSRLSCVGPPCLRYLTVTRWVVSSSAQRTLSSQSEAAHAAGALFHLCSF